MLCYNKIFSLIIKKIIRPENNVFSPTFDKTDKIDLLYKCMFMAYDNIKFNEPQSYVNPNKFDLLDKALNTFTIKDQRENEFLDYFCKIQKVYHALNRFVFLYKYKKAKMVVNTDMELNEINENDRNVICIYQEKAKYLFKFYDIIKIINISLSNSCNFFADPLCIKNPYNNIPFNKSILYYIHFYLTERPNIILKFNILELFLKFHKCHFNLTKFLTKYEYLSREYTIENYVKNNIKDDLYKEIKKMLLFFNRDKSEHKQIRISPGFPKEIVVNIFKPYLLLYINSKNLLIPIIKTQCVCELYKKLVIFQKFNPRFGRIKITFEQKIINNQIKKIQIEEYNDKHIEFENNNNDKFLQDHLSYSHNHYVINHNTFFEDSEEEDDEDDDDHDDDDDDDDDEDDDDHDDDDDDDDDDEVNDEDDDDDDDSTEYDTTHIFHTEDDEEDEDEGPLIYPTYDRMSDESS